MKPDKMILSILLPASILLSREVEKVTAEAADGFFCLLPRHVDVVAALIPGILSYEIDGGSEQYAAVDEGILVKNGTEVTVSVRRGFLGGRLGEIRKRVEKEFMHRSKKEKKTHSAALRIEADLIRRFIEIEG